MILWGRGLAWGTFFAVVTAASVWAEETWPSSGWVETLVKSTLRSPDLEKKAGYAVAVIDLDTGRKVWSSGHRSEQNIYPASMMKTLVAFAALQKVDRKEIRLTDQIEINQSNANEECGLGCERYGLGKRLSVEKLLRDMIIHSNNIATNQLIDLVGKDEIARTASQVGAPEIRVLRKVYVRVNPEPEILERNQGTAQAFVELYTEIASNRSGLLSDDSIELLRQLLARCHAQNRLNAHFPEHVTFFHKTGSTSDSSGDAGYYLLNDRHAVVMVGMQDFRDFKPLQRVGKAVLERFMPAGAAR
jgi:beta-lactamase class A